MRTTCAALAVIGVLLLGVVSAGAFDLTLEDSPDVPPYFVAVSKDTQTFLAFGHHSPLTLLTKLTCTTGQEMGDKVKEGDLKTPEGVYFIEHKLAKGLDYDVYGGLAFTLDYPNPIDRLKGKTGRGIWVHGRGHPINPRETQGCVALNIGDLHRLEASLEPGTPVVIATDVRVSDTPGEFSREAKELVDRVHKWAEAWSNRDDAFFSFYDQKDYTEPGAPTFKAFRDNKERIFAAKPWIDVACFDLHALRGPDYWVTWFGQYYRTDSTTFQGEKRLYWQKDSKGRWVIVGVEYAPAAKDYEALYLQQSTRDVGKMLDAWRRSWEHADLKSYARWYVPSAVQDGRQGLLAIMDQKKELWEKNAPKKVAISGVKVSLDRGGLKVVFRQDYQSASGYSDSGYKTLVVQPSAIGWRIVSETWSAKEPS
ncbi:ErfK/YbiS/YcfS/YnhG family protein [Desulfovibrio sp. X2]|uniref:L,D-transpeptidase family protein n=1 Tax=Desulfovibrio sp. X2 TaxID=941449 RepID=UPI000358C74E|nr:L,D-transpeptidase family protein [Desulfovibrio sp. X2]EPR37629.1 ErfK/YbiS/YcfS/YnhG family protein [Desulfovibrio sp. X2]